MQFIYILLLSFLFVFGLSAESMSGAAHEDSTEMHEEDGDSEESEEDGDSEEHEEEHAE